MLLVVYTAQLHSFHLSLVSFDPLRAMCDFWIEIDIDINFKLCIYSNFLLAGSAQINKKAHTFDYTVRCTVLKKTDFQSRLGDGC